MTNPSAHTQWGSRLRSSVVALDDDLLINNEKKIYVQDIVDFIHLTPSGDTSGVTDYNAIMSAMTSGATIRLDSGTFYISATIEITDRFVSIIGSGQGTIISPINNTFAAITITGYSLVRMRTTISNLVISGGLYCLDINAAPYCFFRNVKFEDASSHGVYIHNEGWIYVFDACEFWMCGGDGLNAINTATQQNGNNITITNCIMGSNTAHGIHWCAAQLNVTGCDFSGNGDSALCIDNVADSALAISINGNYFENNSIAGIELIGATGHVITNVSIVGNYIVDTSGSTPPILATGNMNTVRYVHVDRTNHLSTSGSYLVDFGNVVFYSTIDAANSDDRYNYRVGEVKRFRNIKEELVRTVRTKVDASAGGTAQTTTLLTLQDGAILHDIVAHVETVFDGDTTTTLEVGVSGNIDNYIDTVNFDPSVSDDWQSMLGGGSNDQGSTEFMTADTDIISTWTNVASGVAGQVAVYITFTEPIINY